MRFGKKGKLSPDFIGFFEILQKVRDLAYRVALPPKLSGIHEVFHVSILWKYVYNPSHVILFEPLEVYKNLTYKEKPVEILDWKEQILQNCSISFVKVL